MCFRNWVPGTSIDFFKMTKKRESQLLCNVGLCFYCNRNFTSDGTKVIIVFIQYEKTSQEENIYFCNTLTLTFSINHHLGSQNNSGWKKLQKVSSATSCSEQGHL